MLLQQTQLRGGTKVSGPIMFRFGDASNIGDGVNSALHALFISGSKDKPLSRESKGRSTDVPRGHILNQRGRTGRDSTPGAYTTGCTSFAVIKHRKPQFPVGTLGP